VLVDATQQTDQRTSQMVYLFFAEALTFRHINPAIKCLPIVIPAKAGIQEYTGCRIKPACCRQVRHDGDSLFNLRVNNYLLEINVVTFSLQPFT